MKVRHTNDELSGGGGKINLLTPMVNLFRCVFYAAFLFFSSFMYSQDQDFRPSRQTASEAFSRDDFAEAYRHYSGLLGLYPKDPLYRYFAGICLVRLQGDPLEAVKNLREASAGTGAIKPVPYDVWFWLGRAQQMAGMFDEAVLSYNKYTDLAGRRSAREMNVPDYLREASEGRGSLPVTTGGALPSEGEENPVPAQAARPEAIPVREDPAVQRQKEFAPPEIDTMLAGLLADTISMAAPGKPSAAKPPLQDNEKPSAPPAITTEKGRDTISVSVSAGLKSVSQDNAGLSPPLIDTSAVLKSVPGPVTRKRAVFSVFDNDGKQAGVKVPLNPQVPPGLIYRIQVAIFRNPVAPAYFKNLSPVESFRNEGSDLTVYYAGLFRRHADASQALPGVRAQGFRDAFVVALMDRKQVSLERASVLEKEWGSKPLFEVTEQSAPADTLPPTLVFRVEVVRSQKPLAPDRLEEIKRVAGERGMDILTDEKKQNIYLIGTFLTYVSAMEYTDLLIRNGYREARVAAYLGQREIPVDIARKLFEEYR